MQNEEKECQKQENLEPKEESIVTPWEVRGDINYLKLVAQFGTELISEELIQRFKEITGVEPHPWIKRGIFFSHRGLSQFLNAYANGEPVFLYTGRGPTSDAMHIGHLIPFQFTQWLQKVFKCPLVIQIADDEKAAFKKKNFKEIYNMGLENAKEIISCGFDPEKTFIFSNRDYRLNNNQYETFVSEMKNQISSREVSKIFGFDGDSTVAMYDWPFYQSAAAFYQAFPHIFDGRPAYCLVPYAIDQDPYFRMARDLANKMKLLKPCSIMCTFIPPLTGNSGKMSSSIGHETTLFLNDNAETIRAKILKNCYSGGGGKGTLEDHKNFGGNPDVDVAYQYLRYFEYDDEKLQTIRKRFESGELSCGELKSILADTIIPIILDVQEKRRKVDDKVRDEYYRWKKMKLPQPILKKKLETEQILYEELEKLGIKFNIKYHVPVTTMEEGEELAKTLKGEVCKNLLLKGSEDTYYLYICSSNSNVNLKTLPKKLGIKKIKFAECDVLENLLQVPKGAVTPFAIINDKKKNLNIVVDEELIKGTDELNNYLNFHPLRNDATVTLSYADFTRFLDSYGYKPIVVNNDSSS
jgi:tryptophanyl-tRNA synthetase